ncbi:MAG: DUF4175 family protein [Planctomycetes bacterium]|nr:DUF4175 family protein [Planctomycetota bacterium]
MAFLLPAATAGESEIVKAEDAQRDVGFLSTQEAADFSLLAEEYEINFGADEGRRASDAAALLAHVAREDVPPVVDNIRALRTAKNRQARDAVAAITAGQEMILEKIRTLIDAAAADASADMLARRCQAIIEEQTGLGEDARKVAAATLGKTPGELSREEAARLDNLEKAQARLAGDVRDLENEAERLARDTRTDADFRVRVKDALAAARLAEAASLMEKASDSLGENRIGRAKIDQDAATDRLETFRKALAGDATAGEPRAAVQELIEEQAAVLGETRRADKPTDFERLVRRQENVQQKTGQVSSDLQDKPLASAFLAAAEETMNQAARELADARQEPGGSDSHRGAATTRQEQAADFLAGAAKALDDPTLGNLLKGLAESLDDVDDDARRLETLSGIIEEQTGLKEETQASARQPQALAGLAPRQEDLERRLSRPTAADQAPGSPESTPQKSPFGASADKAREAMSRAAESLKSADAPSAASSQQKAIDALKEARRDTAAEMMQTAEDLQRLTDPIRQANIPTPLPQDAEALIAQAEKALKAVEAARKASSLAESQKQLARQSETIEPNATAPLAQAASREQHLASEAHSLAEAADANAQFAQQAAAAGREMTAAAGDLRGGQPQQATGRMDTAASLLQTAVISALTPGPPSSRESRLPSISGDPQRGIGFHRTRPIGTLSRKPADAAWLARLPAGTSVDIMQAAQGAFPHGYEEVLRKYYESLAGGGDNK